MIPRERFQSVSHLQECPKNQGYEVDLQNIKNCTAEMQKHSHASVKKSPTEQPKILSRVKRTLQLLELIRYYYMVIDSITPL